MKYLLNKYRERENLKVFFYISVATYVLGVLGMYLYFQNKLTRLESSVYAIDPDSGIVFKVERQEYSLVHRELEYRSHIGNFLHLFFQFDQNTFLDNMDRASYLMAIADFEKELDYYKNNNVLERIQGDDVILRINVEKIELERADGEYNGSFEVTQFYRSVSNRTERSRSIKGVFKIMDSQGRTRENPHAATIYDYTITERKNLD